MKIFAQVLTEVLVQLYILTGSLGWSILAFTFLVRSLLLPLSLPSMKSQKQMKELQPELEKLKIKHKNDKKALQVAQMDLYKKYNVNPLSGCLPQLLQFGILIVLYQVFIAFLKQTELNGVTINPHFFWLDLSKPDPSFILPVLAAVTQLILSVMIVPGGEVKDIVPNDSKIKKVKEENKKEEDTAAMAAAMQKQMLFIMPLMTGFLALKFASGLVLYWTATTVFGIVQQYFLSGPGGLTEYTQKAIRFISGNKLVEKTNK
jgi:YidC/Oxa1 family membrane protein insertase